MPIHTGKDKKGYYFQYGRTGHKYYFVKDDDKSKDAAYTDCLKQSQAIHSSGYVEPKKK